VTLPLPTVQRNKPIEGWFEMQPPEHAMKKGHLDALGELNLRVLVKEDVALPYKAYSLLGSVRLTYFLLFRAYLTNATILSLFRHLPKTRDRKPS
jgi:hypothetical protein